MKKQFSITRMLHVYLIVFIVILIIACAGSKVVSVIAENSPFERQNCFVIDAGHGGVDGGATSCTGILESKINLEIAVRLNDLMHLLGMQTHMIRTDDISIHTHGNSIAQKKISDLKERVRIVNSTENAILISIHQNHYTDERYFGPQVFYGAVDGSKQLAEQLQGLLTVTLCPNSKRQCKPATGIYLMQKIHVQGVLIECGFLSNPVEEAKLISEEYQKKLCCVIACALSNCARDQQIT